MSTAAGPVSRSRLLSVFTALLPYAALIVLFGGMGARDLFNLANVDTQGLDANGRPPALFCTKSNLTSLAMDCAPIIVAAAGMTLVMLTGGIDLSVGSMIGVASAVAAVATNFFGNIPLGMAMGVFAGLLCGAFNGTILIIWRVPPFIVTLGALMSLRGVCRLLNGSNASVIIGENIASSKASAAFSRTFKWLANGKLPFADIPNVVPLTAAGVAVLWIVLDYTRLGRRIYAVGSNEEAARLSGVRVGWTKLSAYCIAGMMAGIAGVLRASRLGGSDANQGTGDELFIIAGVVIGGTSLSGGKGTVSGCVVGVVLMTGLSSACTHLHMNDALQKVIIGLFLIGAAAIDRLRTGKTA